MLSVKAELLSDRKIRFSARDKTLVNSLEAGEGPLGGFRSGELLLIALGNCLVNTLMQHQFLHEAEVNSVVAEIEAYDTPAPRRYERIAVTVTITGEGLQKFEERLNRVAGACTIGRTLEHSVTLEVRVRVAEPEKSLLAEGE